MSEKQRMLAELREAFEQWEALLAELDEEQVTAAQEGHSGGLSIKDELAHLWAWQQVSNARMAAAVAGVEVRFPEWLQGLDPDTDDYLEVINERIYEMNRERTWVDVYHDWQEGFSRLMRQAEAVAEADLVQKGRYAWLGEHALMAVLEGTLEHHREHMEELVERMEVHSG